MRAAGEPVGGAPRLRSNPPARPGWPLQGIVSCWIRRRSRATSCHGVGDGVPDGGIKGAGWGLWVAARSAAAHSRDLVCCVNRVEVIPSFSELPGVRRSAQDGARSAA